jgi:homoserine dehydrogenase
MTTRFVMVGVGNIGRNVLEIVVQKQEQLRNQYGMQLLLVAAVDSGGAAFDPQGLDPAQVLQLKRAGNSVASYPAGGEEGVDAVQALQRADADLLVELSPTNLRTGEPGLSAISWALANGMDVVTANKGPLVLGYTQLDALAAEHGRSLSFSGAVAGGLPTVNIGQRDLAGTTIKRVEGIFNCTTNYILQRMSEDDLTFDQALAEAQAAGVAEADPTLDIDGWDAANKLVIVANSVLGMPASLDDVAVQGIRGIGVDQLQRAKERGHALKLLVTAERVEVGEDATGAPQYELAVRPTELPLAHPMARLTRWQMGVIYTSDTMGHITAIIEDEGTSATSAAVLRDVIHTVVG